VPVPDVVREEDVLVVDKVVEPARSIRGA